MTSCWVGERVRLRGTEPGDWEAFRRFDQVSDDQRASHQVHPPRSAAGYRKLFLTGAETAPTGDEFGLIISSVDSDEAVGSITTHDCSARSGTFSFGIQIGREHQRRGYASEAIVLILRFMFDERRYQKCNSMAYDFNVGSIALHRRLGFVEEGRIRRNHFLGGRYCDDILLGLTAEEFHERHGAPGDAG